MDIEELSKTQLLLLTMLVSFVTSIATGVLTVSLLDQAPTTVTQTVNRIVDHTIETVTTQVPVVGSNEPQAPSTEDLLVSAIATNSARSVAVYRNDSRRGEIGAGLYLSASRKVLIVSTDNPSRIFVVFPDGSSAEAEREGEDGNLVSYAFEAGATLPAAPAANLVSAADVKPGQTLIALNSEGAAVTGIVSKVEGETIVSSLPASVPAGAGVVNLSGNVVGIGGGGGTVLSANRINALITAQ